MATPLLKWPGGKRWLAPKIVPHLDGAFKRYIEPFLGGGAILFALKPLEAIASDINPHLIACYQTIKKNGHRVLREFNKLQTGKSEYYRIRDRWNPKCEFKRAARLLYLLRHSWNGLYRVNKGGRFNVPYCPRERRGRLTDEMISNAQVTLQRVRLECQDFMQTLGEAKEGDLIFADPPYFEDGRETFGRYSSIVFREAQQKHLINALAAAEGRGAAWVLTNGSLEQVRRHFLGCDIFVIPRQSSIAADPRARRKIAEYIVLSRASALAGLRRFLNRQHERVPM